MYENLLDLLLFYNLFLTTILNLNENDPGVGYTVARFTNYINSRYNHLPRMNSRQSSISAFEGCLIKT